MMVEHQELDLDELERFTDQWANNPHNGDTIYSLAWMEGPENARTEASATLTVSGLLALVARVREAEARVNRVVKLRDLMQKERDDVDVSVRLSTMIRDLNAALTGGDDND